MKPAAPVTKIFTPPCKQMREVAVNRSAPRGPLGTRPGRRASTTPAPPGRPSSGPTCEHGAVSEGPEPERDWFGNPLRAEAAAVACPSCGTPHTDRDALVRHLADAHGISAGIGRAPRGTAVGPTYWCAAADYSQRGLKAAWTAKIYIARGLGPSVTTGRRSAVQFTLDPKAAGVTPTPPSLSINALKTGDSLSVQQAFTYCNTALTGF